jgi:hypothetical protein
VKSPVKKLPTRKKNEKMNCAPFYNFAKYFRKQIAVK